MEGGARVEAAVTALETVLPKPGGRVLVVAGRYAGARGVLTGVDVDAFKAGVRLQDAPHDGLQVRTLAQTLTEHSMRGSDVLTCHALRAQVQLEYEQVCKTEAQ